MGQELDRRQTNAKRPVLLIGASGETSQKVRMALTADADCVINPHIASVFKAIAPRLPARNPAVALAFVASFKNPVKQLVESSNG